MTGRCGSPLQHQQHNNREFYSIKLHASQRDRKLEFSLLCTSWWRLTAKKNIIVKEKQKKAKTCFGM